MAWGYLRGHDEQVERFRRAVAKGRLASTFLFVGPPGIGKRSFALRLAQALLCERTAEAALAPCGECFVAFSLQMAPLNSANPLGAWSTPAAKTFSFVSPDRLWLGFMYSRSQGALAGEKFDPAGEFLPKFHDRRVKFAAPEASLRFPR